MNTINLHTPCFGRKAILSLLTRRLNDLKEGYRQNLALLGSRYIGKSTVLQRFINEIDDDKVIAIYLNLENRDFDYFYSKIVRSILYNFAKSKNLTPQDDIKVLLEMTRSLIPETVEAIEKVNAF